MQVKTAQQTLLQNVEVRGRAADVRICGARISAVAAHLPPQNGEQIVQGKGGALLPGLHDHHMHILALAAARESVPCGPPQVRSARELQAALSRAAPRAGWLRGVGYHESVAGALHREALDRLTPNGVAVRIQHRGGALWMLNSEALRRLGAARESAAFATGRLFRQDRWLRARMQSGAAKGAAPGMPPLAQLGAQLARYGVTGVTDATPGNGAAEVAHLQLQQARGAFPQRVYWMGGAQLPPPPQAPGGAWKLLVEERALPLPAQLARQIARAHNAARRVALHCTTRAELAVACAALQAAGVREGDRIEHASVCAPDALEWLARLRLTVVTQPNFVYERGDAYRKEVPARDLPWLYRGRAFAEAGVALGGGSDAPFGAPDPWLAMRAAVHRRSAGGAVLGAAEALSPERALALFTTAPDAPGGAPRQIRAGAAADLCLLKSPWARARETLSADEVRATWCAGRRAR